MRARGVLGAVLHLCLIGLLHYTDKKLKISINYHFVTIGWLAEEKHAGGQGSVIKDPLYTVNTHMCLP